MALDKVVIPEVAVAARVLARRGEEGDTPEARTSGSGRLFQPGQTATALVRVIFKAAPWLSPISRLIPTSIRNSRPHR